jgi:tetratricopeptide (TPR) repeat protein
MQGSIERMRGDVRRARDLGVQALAAFEALGNESGTATVLANIAELEFGDGHPEEALRAISQAFEIDLRGKNAADIALDYSNIAGYRIALGDLTAARDAALEGLRLARQVRQEQTIAITLQHLALLSALSGEARRGAQLLGYVGEQYAVLGMQRESTEQWSYEKLMAALRETLSPDEIATLGEEGAAWSEDQAVEEALKV